jgi:LysR family glycine cleavage system transcriptional activator
MHRLRSLLAPLRVFDAVVRTGGVTRAAEVLHVTPGAISQQIRSLESSIGVALFQKKGREIEVTLVGRQLALRVGDAFDRIANALAEAATLNQDRKLRLKVSPSLAIRWLVPRLTSFYGRHPDIDLEIATVSRVEDQRLEDADFGIRHGRGDWTDLAFDQLFNDEFIPVCSPQMAQSITSPQGLRDVKLLHSMMRPTAWDIWFQSLGLTQDSHARGITLANAALCYQAAVDGLGVAMAQRTYVGDDLATGRLAVPVDHVATTESGYYLVCDPLKTDHYAIKAFREWIREQR